MEVADALAGLDVRLVVVSFAPPAAVVPYAAGLELARPARFLCDPERALYARLGIGRASAARVWLHPAVWLAYARLLRRGLRASAPAGDALQLGGDAVLDRAGRVVWLHRSRGPDDRPTGRRVAEQASHAVTRG